MAAQPGIPSGHADAFSFDCKSEPYEMQNTYNGYDYSIVLKPNLRCFSGGVCADGLFPRAGTALR